MYCYYSEENVRRRPEYLRTWKLDGRIAVALVSHVWPPTSPFSGSAVSGLFADGPNLLHFRGRGAVSPGKQGARHLPGSSVLPSLCLDRCPRAAAVRTHRVDGAHGGRWSPRGHAERTPPRQTRPRPGGSERAVGARPGLSLARPQSPGRWQESRDVPATAVQTGGPPRAAVTADAEGGGGSPARARAGRAAAPGLRLLICSHRALFGVVSGGCASKGP